MTFLITSLNIASSTEGYAPVPGSLKTEAVVLRSIRYGEADRVLHLYPPYRGRVGAIAKGGRKARSRFGGRLEPFFRLDLVLYEGPRPAHRDRRPKSRLSSAARGPRGTRRRRLRGRATPCPACSRPAIPTRRSFHLLCH